MVLGHQDFSRIPQGSANPENGGWSLYVHVPFCARKCDYCAFYSEPALELGDRFTEALITELHLRTPLTPPSTVFFGGGTPTLLTIRQWERVLAAIHHRYPGLSCEWTVESNPASLSLDKARLLRQGGVNRISMGVQSLDEQLLDRLGRVHSRDMVFRSYDTLRQAGFDNLNLDLMFALPGQSMEVWQATLDETLQMQSEHVSSYEIIYEEDTPLFHQLQAKEIDVDEDLACAMYEALRESCSKRGLDQYEIANFGKSRPGDPHGLPSHACRHNLTYWRGRPYLGLGPSASSFMDGVRTRNWSNTRLYCDCLEKGNAPLESRDDLPPLARAGEIAAFGLRMVVGWQFNDFTAATGFDLREHWSREMNQLVACGWGELNDRRFCLSTEGLRFADAAGAMFLRTPAEAPALQVAQ
jgi:oxygen-independent coproporphyrinogen-3 oxidase